MPYRGVDRSEGGLVEHDDPGLLYRVKLTAVDGQRPAARDVALQRTDVQHHRICGERKDDEAPAYPVILGV